MMKKSMILLIWIILLSTQALALDIAAGTTFSPSATNCTYQAGTNINCDNVTVDKTCVNITGGIYEYDWCLECGLTPTTYSLITTINKARQDNCYTNPFFNEGNVTLLGIIPLLLFGGIIIMYLWNWKWNKKQNYPAYIALAVLGIIATWILGQLLSGMGC